jgi:predicted nucleic acid-binding protein
MPHYFLDTSALVKHYHAELGSPKVDQILGEAGSASFIARLTLTEVPSVFAKKVRTGELIDADFGRLRLRFYADVRNRTLTPIRVLNGHFESAGDLIARHGKTRQIHTLDALQLAVALSIQQPTAIDQFVCADQRLCEIATLEGLAVINPEQPESNG